jgi:hypothetical protein
VPKTDLDEKVAGDGALLLAGGSERGEAVLDARVGGGLRVWRVRLAAVASSHVRNELSLS